MESKIITEAVKTYQRKIASMGGKARARKLSAERRHEIAVQGGKARASQRKLKGRKK